MDADYLKDVADLCLRLPARGRRDRLDRRVVLLHPARPRPLAARTSAPTATQASPASTGASTAAASTTRRSTRSRPRVLPEPLHWFKWEAYTTWLSGFALLVLLYWSDAETRLVDPAVADLAPGRPSRSRRALLARRVARLRHSPAASCATTSRVAVDDGAARRRRRRGPRPSSSPRGRPTSRSARCSGRSWPRTSSS